MNLHEKARALLNRYQYAKGVPEQQALDTIADLLAENERLNGVVQAQHETLMEAITRTNAAEAQLRELANAEPVALIVTHISGEPRLTWPAGIWPFGTALIRRPEMPT